MGIDAKEKNKVGEGVEDIIQMGGRGSSYSAQLRKVSLEQRPVGSEGMGHEDI